MGEGQGGGEFQILSPLTSILSPAFAEAASRRQALRGEEVFCGGYFLRDRREDLWRREELEFSPAAGIAPD